MSLIVYAIPFFLACIALEMLISVLKKRKVYRFHDTVTSLNIGFISETIRVLVKLLPCAARSWSHTVLDR